MASSLESLTDEQVRLLRVVSRNRRLRAVLGVEPRYFLVDSASGGARRVRERDGRKFDRDVSALVEAGLLRATRPVRRGRDRVREFVCSHAGLGVAVTIGRAEAIA